MLFRQITDFGAAYTNASHVADSARWPQAWVQPAQEYRQAMQQAGRARLGLAWGSGARHGLDLFLPAGTARGLLVFIHGGYWKSLDRSYWSHLAHGAVQHGMAVAMPSYDLCPDVRIAEIAGQIAAAVTRAAQEVAGPLVLAGHSAGGHLAARLVSTGSALPPEVLARVRLVLPISGLHDLRPLLGTPLNADLRLDEAEAQAESPALLRPLTMARLCAWVGGAERPEFLRQSELLANVWTGLGMATGCHAEPDLHHFNVIDGLADPGHPIVRLIAKV